MEHDEMIEWMLENPGEADALFESYKEAQDEQKKRDAQDARRYLIRSQIAVTLSKLGSERFSWKLKITAPEFSTDNGWLGFQSDTPARLAFFQSFFLDPDQAKAVSDAVDLVQEAEEVMSGMGELIDHSKAPKDNTLETICPKCSFEDCWDLSDISPAPSATFACSECEESYDVDLRSHK